MTTYKSFMKGFRYFSQMFESDEEEEMEIGFPTDVKHVAHIGNDGSSSSNTPSWMNEYQGVSETSSAALNNSNGKPPAHQTAKSAAKDLKVEGSSRDAQKFSEAPIESPNRGKTKHSRRQANAGSDSPGREELVIQKPRRHKNPSIESPGRKHNSNLESPRRPSNSKMGAASPSRDPNVAPKPARRKKKGGSAGEGSTRSRSKGTERQTESFPYSDPGPGRDTGSSEICQKSILSTYEEKKDCEENSRGIHAL